MTNIFAAITDAVKRFFTRKTRFSDSERSFGTGNGTFGRGGTHGRGGWGGRA